MAELQHQLVLSEVHVGTCPPGDGAWQTRFVIRRAAAVPGGETSSSSSSSSTTTTTTATDSSPVRDEDGDYDLRRPTPGGQTTTLLTIKHARATPIATCGTQIWRGACLLADFLVNTPEVVAGRAVLELGAGVGLVSLVSAGASRASTVWLTDNCTEALDLAAENARQLLHHPARSQQRPGASPGLQDPAAGSGSGDEPAPPRLLCRRLDWDNFLCARGRDLAPCDLLELLNAQSQPCPTGPDGSHAPPAAGHPCSSRSSSSSSWAWCGEDVRRLSQVQVLLAADVIYEPVLTEAFLACAAALMEWLRGSGGAAAASEGPVLFVAAERRYNFTLRDMDAVATAFDHFLSFVQETGHRGDGPREAAPPAGALFLGERIHVDDMPQLLGPYDRGQDLELWRLWLPPCPAPSPTAERRG